MLSNVAAETPYLSTIISNQPRQEFLSPSAVVPFPLSEKKTKIPSSTRGGGGGGDSLLHARMYVCRASRRVFRGTSGAGTGAYSLGGLLLFAFFADSSLCGSWLEMESLCSTCCVGGMVAGPCDRSLYAWP